MLVIKPENDWKLTKTQTEGAKHYLMVPINRIQIPAAQWREVCGYPLHADRNERRAANYKEIQKFYHDHISALLYEPGHRTNLDGLLTALSWQNRLQATIYNDRLTRGRRSAELDLEHRKMEAKATDDLLIALFNGRDKANKMKKKWILGFGNGDFQVPGFAKVPRLKLMEALKSHALDVVLVNECYTSKLSCCCHCPTVKAVRWSEAQRQEIEEWKTVHCVKCGATMQRDFNAALNIGWKFMDMQNDGEKQAYKFDRLTQEAYNEKWGDLEKEFREKRKKKKAKKKAKKRNSQITKNESIVEAMNDMINIVDGIPMEVEKAPNTNYKEILNAPKEKLTKKQLKKIKKKKNKEKELKRKEKLKVRRSKEEEELDTIIKENTEENQLVIKTYIESIMKSSKEHMAIQPLILMSEAERISNCKLNRLNKKIKAKTNGARKHKPNSQTATSSSSSSSCLLIENRTIV
jgi:hypothetical protein